jgi:peptidyl-prolyl cis-trans isomerase C
MRAAVCVAIVASLAIAGCDKAAGDGDVLATVAGEKITQAQLDAELRVSGVTRPDNPDIRRAALEQIVTRKLLARAARAEDLDKTSQGRLIKAVAMESVDAGLALGAMQARVKPPTPAEAQGYVQAHPERFAERSGYIFDQLRASVPTDPALVAALGPAKTLEEVESVLRARGIPFRRSVQGLDTLRANPELSAAIRRLPPGEPFVLNEPGGFSVSRVRQSAVRPIVGAPANAIAADLLLAERRAKAINDRIASLKADLVTYPKAAPAK